MANTGKALTVAIVLLVSLAILAEGWFVSQYIATFHQHMAYQVAHKGRHSLVSLVASSRGAISGADLVASFGMIAAAVRTPKSFPGFWTKLFPLPGLFLALSAYVVFGREVPTTFTPMLLFRLPLAANDRRPAAPRRSPAAKLTAELR